MNTFLNFSLVLALLTATFATPILAEEEPQAPSQHHGGPPPGGPPPDGPGNFGPGHGALHTPPGKWWSNPTYVQLLGLTADQQKRIEDIFYRNRLVLIDLSAALQKQEAMLEPLLDADHPDEAKILSQIDHVAAARAELEKGNARMLLGFRSALSQEQWKRLADAPRPGPPPHRP